MAKEVELERRASQLNALVVGANLCLGPKNRALLPPPPRPTLSYTDSRFRGTCLSLPQLPGARKRLSCFVSPGARVCHPQQCGRPCSCAHTHVRATSALPLPPIPPPVLSAGLVLVLVKELAEPSLEVLSLVFFAASSFNVLRSGLRCGPGALGGCSRFYSKKTVVLFDEKNLISLEETKKLLSLINSNCYFCSG